MIKSGNSEDLAAGDFKQQRFILLLTLKKQTALILQHKEAILLAAA